MVFGEDLAEPVERALGPAGDDDAARRAARSSAMCRTTTSKTLDIGSARPRQSCGHGANRHGTFLAPASGASKGVKSTASRGPSEVVLGQVKQIRRTGL
jgi:hypothetical protein